MDHRKPVEIIQLRTCDHQRSRIDIDRIIPFSVQLDFTAKLWKIRQGVQISADYVGTPAEGYQVGAVRTVPDTISVAGSAEGLESLADNNNVITIPEDSIDISGESEDVEKKISLTNLLPDNVKLTSDSSEDVWVTVSILPAGSREFEFPTKNIEVKNKPKDLQVTFEHDTWSLDYV